jgi:hypothetical protein
MNKKILTLVALVGVLVFPYLAEAQTITGMVANIANLVYEVAVGIVVIIWIITGLLFLTALGAPEKLKTAKVALFASIAGTIIVILATFAMPMIKNALGV